MDKENPHLVIKGLRTPRVRRQIEEKPDPAAGTIDSQRPNPARQAKEAARAQELADALDSPYYWWWVFVRESEEVALARKRKKVDPVVEKLAKDFGNLDRTFEDWWFRTGRYLFAQTRPMPKVREMLQGDFSRGTSEERIFLEVPLTIRRASVIRQINKLLAKYYKPEDSSQRVNVFAHSSAEYDLIRSSKIRLTTFAQFHQVWQRRAEHPDESWPATGWACHVSPTAAKLKPTASWSQYEIDRSMGLAAQRIYRKTKRLIYWAARGEFPCIDKCPSEGQTQET